MEGGNPILEWITYAMVGFVLLTLGFFAVRSAYFFLSLLFIPVLGALGRTRLFGGAVRRWGERGPKTGMSSLGASDEAAVDEATRELNRVRVPRAVSVGLRVGAAVGAVPGIWQAVVGARLAAARGETAGEIAATVALALSLVAAAGTLVGAGLGALAGAGVDAMRRRRG